MLIKPEVIEPGEKIRVAAVKTKEFKTAQITVSLLVSREKNLAENIIIPKYLTRSSEKYPTAAALNAKLESLYGATLSGDVARKGENSRIEISITCVDDRFSLDGESVTAQCLELVMDILFNPFIKENCFDEKKFELERRLAIESVESELNDKRLYALTRMTEIMCEDEIYGISKAETIEALKSADAKSTYKAWCEMLEEATVQVNLVGDIDACEAAGTIGGYFEKIKRHPNKNETVFVEAAQDVTEVTEDMDINQSKLVIGYRSGMTDRNDGIYKEQIMTDIFGGGTYSRLFMNVREKLSLCYYCSARYYREKGIIVIQSGIEKENRQKVLDEIAKQLEIMRNGEFEEKDFIASKTATCDLLRCVCDTPDGIDNYLISKIDEEIVPIEKMISEYEKVTREDIVEMAKRMSLDTIYMLSGKGSGEDE